MLWRCKIDGLAKSGIPLPWRAPSLCPPARPPNFLITTQSLKGEGIFLSFYNFIKIGGGRDKNFLDRTIRGGTILLRDIT
jgi:hypothetical protein